MDTVVLSALFFNSAGIVVIALGTALAYCLPNRHQPRRWVLADAEAAPNTTAVSVAVASQADAVQLSQAA